MSEWITNAKTSYGVPEYLRGVKIEAELPDGRVETRRADAFHALWATNEPCHIVRYRIVEDVKQASETQVGGTHYVSLSIQPWDAMQSWLTPEQFKGYLLGSVIKYLGRFNAEAANKGGMVDVRKAIQFLNKLVEVADD